MKSHSNRRPSPALIVSVVALLVALGGSAYAVKKNSVRSKNIVNGAVSGKDIRDGAVKGKHVNEGTLSFRCPSGTEEGHRSLLRGRALPGADPLGRRDCRL